MDQYTGYIHNINPLIKTTYISAISVGAMTEIAPTGHMETQAPHPLHTVTLNSGCGTLPAHNLKSMARTSHCSAQLRQMTPW